MPPADQHPTVSLCMPSPVASPSTSAAARGACTPREPPRLGTRRPCRSAAGLPAPGRAQADAGGVGGSGSALRVETRRGVDRSRPPPACAPRPLAPAEDLPKCWRKASRIRTTDAKLGCGTLEKDQPPFLCRGSVLPVLSRKGQNLVYRGSQRLFEDVFARRSLGEELHPLDSERAAQPFGPLHFDVGGCGTGSPPVVSRCLRAHRHQVAPSSLPDRSGPRDAVIRREPSMEVAAMHVATHGGVGHGHAELWQ